VTPEQIRTAALAAAVRLVSEKQASYVSAEAMARVTVVQAQRFEQYIRDGR
jgi:hypothetical protein